MSNEYSVEGFKPSEAKMAQYELPPWTDPTRSENIEQLVQALSLAQSKIRSPERNRVVNVTPKGGGQGYSFKYATLDHIIEIVREPLTANGLWFTQIMKLDEGTYILDTRLMHGSGQWIACQTPLLFDGGSNQQFGSALTFMRRYSLTSLLGIAAEEDDDANTADGNTINQTQDRKPVAPRPDVMKDGVALTSMAHPDPISTGNSFHPDQIIGKPFPLFVAMKEDESGSDWVGFGKNLIATVKGSRTAQEADAWREANKSALAQMEKDAPRTYANLSASIIKAIADMKKEK